MHRSLLIVVLILAACRSAAAQNASPELTTFHWLDAAKDELKMTIDAKTTILWAVALLLFLASAWSMNNATFFLFAADFPGEYRHLYESRGTHFFVLAITLFVGCVDSRRYYSLS